MLDPLTQFRFSRFFWLQRALNPMMPPSQQTAFFRLCPPQHTSVTVLTSFHSLEDFTSLCHQYHLTTECIRHPDLTVIVYHGVLAPNHRWRGRVTPAKRGKAAKRIHSPKSARTLLKNAWHRRLHALVQEWTDMNCATTSANNFSRR